MKANFDIALLRTLAAVVDLGSVARAAETVGRSQPAVSLQLKRLEAMLGTRLFRKEGRGLVVTEAGDVLLGYARRMLDLNDDAFGALGALDLAGTIRLGIPQDLADGWLTQVLARFARAHPAVLIEVKVERNGALMTLLERGKLDLAITLGTQHRARAVRLGTVPVIWIGAKSIGYEGARPVSLVAFEPPCHFRTAAIAALDGARIPWRLSFSSPSLSSQWAAVEAGLGIAVRTPLGLPASLCVLPQGVLPSLAPVELGLQRGASPTAAPVARLEEILVERVTERVRQAA